MKIIQILCFALVVALGIAMFIFGGYDDSPGAQLLGVLIAAAGLWGLVRTIRKKRS